MIEVMSKSGSRLAALLTAAGLALAAPTSALGQPSNSDRVGGRHLELALLSGDVDGDGIEDLLTLEYDDPLEPFTAVSRDGGYGGVRFAVTLPDPEPPVALPGPTVETMGAQTRAYAADIDDDGIQDLVRLAIREWRSDPEGLQWWATSVTTVNGRTGEAWSLSHPGQAVDPVGIQTDVQAAAVEEGRPRSLSLVDEDGELSILRVTADRTPGERTATLAWIQPEQGVVSSFQIEEPDNWQGNRTAYSTPGDLDGDGAADVLSRDYGTSGSTMVRAYAHDGNPLWTATVPVPFQTSNAIRSLPLDGTPGRDLLFGNDGRAAIGGRSGALLWVSGTEGGWQPWRDVDSDGGLDVLESDRFETSPLPSVTIRSGSDGQVLRQETFESSMPAGAYELYERFDEPASPTAMLTPDSGDTSRRLDAAHPRVGDLDGDGTADLSLVACAPEEGCDWWLLSGATLDVLRFTPSGMHDPSPSGVDLDANGAADLWDWDPYESDTVDFYRLQEPAPFLLLPLTELFIAPPWVARPGGGGELRALFFGRGFTNIDLTMVSGAGAQLWSVGYQES